MIADPDACNEELLRIPKRLRGEHRAILSREWHFADQDLRSTEEDQMVTQESNNVEDVKDVGDDLPPLTEIKCSGVSCKKSVFARLRERAPAACTECGREFGSWKALFGHMRCHPEREWRGIQPPAEHLSMKPNPDGKSRKNILVNPSQSAVQICSKTAGSLADRFEHNFELQWSASRVQAMLEEEDESETESIEAAYISSKEDVEQDGMSHHQSTSSLRRGKRSNRSHFTVKSLRSVQDQSVDEGLHGEEPYLSRTEDLEMAACLVMLALAGPDTDAEKQEDEDTALNVENRGFADQTDEEEESSGDGDPWSRARLNDSIISRKGAAEDSGRYECAACKRIFKSHQALGGHRASHKKVKGCFAKTAGDGELPPAQQREGMPGGELALHDDRRGNCRAMAEMADEFKLALQSSSKYHRCSICQRVFASGQALGGHKRCHWAPDKTTGNNTEAMESFALIAARSDVLATAQTASIASPPSLASLSFFPSLQAAEINAAARVRVLGIDLNLPAPLDQENGEASIEPAAGSSLLSLGQSSHAQNHVHQAMAGASVLSISPSPSCSTSPILSSHTGPC